MSAGIENSKPTFINHTVVNIAHDLKQDDNKAHCLTDRFLKIRNVYERLSSSVKRGYRTVLSLMSVSKSSGVQCRVTEDASHYASCVALY